MSMFAQGKERTKEYLAAIEAVHKVATRQGLDWASRAYAEAMAPLRRKEFEGHGLRESSERVCIKQLLGDGCGEVGSCTPPGSDHDSVWMKNGKPVVYLMQPFGLSWQKLRELVAFCEKHNIEAKIDAWPSYYFPDNAISVLLQRPTPNPEARP